MVERVTVEQIREAYQAQDAYKLANLVYNYLEQNPDIRQKFVEKMVSNFTDKLVNYADYREIALDDAVKFTVKREI